MLTKISLLALAALGAAGLAQPGPDLRGELLYANHCVECHSQQMHWRAQRLARDWNTLRAQVGRWQAEGRLEWSEDDIDAVAGYLNDTIYGFPRPRGAARAPGRWDAPRLAATPPAAGSGRASLARGGSSCRAGRG